MFCQGCAKPYEKEYRTIGAQCAESLNDLSTVLDGERRNRVRLYHINPEVKHRLDLVRTKLKPEFTNYFNADAEFLKRRTAQNLNQMKVALGKIKQLDMAARDVIKTNSMKL